MAVVVALALILVGVAPGPARADLAALRPEPPPRWSLGFNAGWGFGLPFPDPDDEVVDTRFAALAPRWALSLGEYRDGSAGDGRLDLVAEGTLLLQHAPRDGLAAGANVLLRYDFDGRGRFRPYVEGGVGMLHLDFDLREQADGFSYSLLAGLGLRWPLSKRLSLDTGLRYHHISNSGLELPNVGLNTLVLGVGLSWSGGGD